jgi:hypothetical protein
MQMKFRTVTMAAAAIIASAIATPSMAAELITNGSFSAGLTGWTVSPLPQNDIIVTPGQPYTGIGGSGSVASLTNPFADFGAGQQPNVSTLSQTFNTVAGQTYALSFSAGAFGSGSPQSFMYSFGGNVGFLPIVNDNNFDTTFHTSTFFFTSAGGPTTLSFKLIGDSNNQDGFLDNVSVTGPAVPEPATWAMMLLGFGMMGFGLRFRARKANKTRFA